MPAHLFVSRTTEYGFARHHQFEDVVVEAADLARAFAVFGVPDVNLLVASGGEHPLAVLAEGDGKDGSLMAGVSRFQIAGLRVVNARGAVAAGRGEIRAVAAPG